MIGNRQEGRRSFHARRGLYDLLPLIRPRQQVPKSLPNFNHLLVFAGGAIIAGLKRRIRQYPKHCDYGRHEFGGHPLRPACEPAWASPRDSAGLEFHHGLLDLNAPTSLGGIGRTGTPSIGA